MVNEVIPTPSFLKELKRFCKKFPSLKNEILDLESSLCADPHQGEPLTPGLYKIRLACKSKGKGKSGGFRVITYLLEESEIGIKIYLVILYDKSEVSTIDNTVLTKYMTVYLSENSSNTSKA